MVIENGKLIRVEEGAVIYGPCNNRDLIPCFSTLLKSLCEDNAAHLQICVDADLLEDYGSQWAETLVNSLIEAIDHYAPLDCYFGENVGDDESDWGFWRCM